MNELIGQIGDVATGTLVASAAEPAAGAVSERAHPAICRNCQTALNGAYCHACGQRGHVHRTIASIGHDLAHGVFHFEGKIWHTLPLLMWRPGDLTRRYIAGERARFISPVALFLFSVFLLATVLGSLPGSSTLDGLRDGIADSSGGLAKAQKEVSDNLTAAKDKRVRVARDKEPTAEIDAKIAKLTQEQAQLAAIQKGRPTDVITGAKVHSKWDFINDRFKHAQQNPELLIYQLKNSAYKFS